MFADRKDAGLQLAQALFDFHDQPNVIILSLPRGGVPVAYEVVVKLHLPLDVLLVRKLGIPHNEETAMGAIAMDGVCVMNEDLIKRLNISHDEIIAVIQKEQQEINERNKIYHEHRPKIVLDKQVVILVDDGMATGATMKVAVKALKEKGIERIIIAVPVCSDSARDELQKEVEKVVAVLVPPDLSSVGEWYENFTQTSHEEVKELLKKSLQEM
ncbi:MAG: phosphoribosyltransferase [Pseudomonadota bacterium]